MTTPEQTQPPCDGRRPSWLNGDSVSKAALQKEVERCREKLMNTSTDDQRDGVEELYALITCIWSQQAGQVARTAADFVCDEIRCKCSFFS